MMAAFRASFLTFRVRKGEARGRENHHRRLRCSGCCHFPESSQQSLLALCVESRMDATRGSTYIGIMVLQVLGDLLFRRKATSRHIQRQCESAIRLVAVGRRCHGRNAAAPKQTTNNSELVNGSMRPDTTARSEECDLYVTGEPWRRNVIPDSII
jgi:hypothetical protein